MTVDADEKFDAELAEFQPALLGRMNDDFEDSVVFVARVLTGRSATTGRGSRPSIGRGRRRHGRHRG